MRDTHCSPSILDRYARCAHERELGRYGMCKTEGAKVYLLYAITKFGDLSTLKHLVASSWQPTASPTHDEDSACARAMRVLTFAAQKAGECGNAENALWLSTHIALASASHRIGWAANAFASAYISPHNITTSDALASASNALAIASNAAAIASNALGSASNALANASEDLANGIPIVD
jgi:hypothetical protein